MRRFGFGCTTLARRQLRGFMDQPTKGDSAMKHLDLYARRDPQLAPFLIREVDIEWKRKCRKVNFVVWVAILTGLSFLDQRLSLESMYYMKGYAELAQQEQDVADEDFTWRRARLVQILKHVRSVHQRNVLTADAWTKQDTAVAQDILNDSSLADCDKVPSRTL